MKLNATPTSTDHNLKEHNLNAANIPLTGSHLIEASAGTGKTYNITRIYLRLLLERELKVEQILLMTFTKDATQELRGRIDVFIRDALTNWSTLCEKDDYFKAINQRVSTDKVQFLLKRALLFLDEAAIFTIHGFCQRALAEHAFASGLPFNATLSTTSAEMVLEACQDWYRQLGQQSVNQKEDKNADENTDKSADDFLLVAQFWSQPADFIRSFNKAINQQHELETIDSQKIVIDFIELAKQASKALIDNNSLLQEGLLSHKNAAEQEKRSQELAHLQAWLAQVQLCHDDISLLTLLKSSQNSMPDYLLNGNRHPKAFKVQLSSVLVNCKLIKVQLKTLAKNINRAKAYQLVRLGIYQMRQQVQNKKLQQNLLDFDDLISILANCLSNHLPDCSPDDLPEKSNDNNLASTLLSQYPVALVDEFQDTDPQQFSILQSLYYSEQAKQREAALYLIGDPKQAIYGFRGGDIFAYLSARHGCDYHWFMDTNYRSTPDMVNAYNQVFMSGKGAADDVVFGYGIEYQAVKSGKLAEEAIDESTDKSKALQFVHFSQPEEESVTLGFACPLMATWCANEITELLSTAEPATIKVKPQDIAILVRDNREAQFIKQALQNAGLASVFLSDRTNLFHSTQAKQLLTLLKGILSPEHERTYLAALVSGLLGFNALKLYQLQQDEMAYQTLKFTFIDYKKQWQQQGFIAMAINLMHQHFQVPMQDKDRTLTNILHLFEILQAASQRFLQPEELLYWFEQQCQLDNINSELEAELRLENDGDLIRIITQHGAKGLEYPIVFIPFSCKHKDPLKFGNKNISYLEYHDEQGNLRLSLDGDEQAKTAMADEAYAESIRLLYVAITRAEKRCYLLTAPFDKSHLSPLGKTLQWQADAEPVQALQLFVDKTPNTTSLTQVSFDEITVNRNDQPQGDQPSDQQDDQKSNQIKRHLKVSKFVGKIERDWWLSSFSALSRNVRHGGVSIPDRDSELEPLASSIPPTTNAANAANTINTANTATNLLRFMLTKGAHTGNLLHSILEQTDFCQPNWRESIKWPLVNYGELTAPFTESDLIIWLDEVVQTPLVSNVSLTSGAMEEHKNSFCLADITLKKSLRESEFYFPMKQASMQGLAKLLTDHRNSGIDHNALAPVSAHKVRLPHYQVLKGMMHGFIDLVFEHQGKYYLCDYKSSHLGNSFADYQHQALRNSVEKNYYDLQYLIYSLALHRYLTLNLKDYNAQEHFGGIYYLYLRGMTNDKAYTGSGIYYRTITMAELAQLDELFAGTSADKYAEKGAEKDADKSKNNISKEVVA
ncbi:MAG: exodeoxyribonuclease V subunit beta [Colwellia sp.]|nr:exodeoxyribonuclease V subunit beta [Colwellia sp.]